MSTSFWVRLFFPILFSFVVFIKHISQYFHKIYSCLVIMNFSVVSSYFFLKENILFDEMEKNSFIRTTLPKTSYFLSLMTIIIYFSLSKRKCPNLSREIKFIQIILPIWISSLMIIGKNSFILCLCLFYILYLYIQTMKYLRLSENIQTFAYLSCLSYYFWHAFGNKPQIAALQVNNVYIGFETFNFYISGVLLIINCGASFLLLVCLLPLVNLFSKKVINVYHYEDEKKTNMEKFIYFRNVIYFGIYFVVAITCTSANCIVQRRALLLIEDFAPKFFFDGVIFAFVNLILGGILIIFGI